MNLVKVRRHYQITLPGSLRKKFNISEGDYMEVEDRNEGILIKPVKVIHPDQEYFYTKEWQKGESEADKDISEGRIEELDTGLKRLEDEEITKLYNDVCGDQKIRIDDHALAEEMLNISSIHEEEEKW